jgi:hypothetical protein
MQQIGVTIADHRQSRLLDSVAAIHVFESERIKRSIESSDFTHHVRFRGKVANALNYATAPPSSMIDRHPVSERRNTSVGSDGVTGTLQHSGQVMPYQSRPNSTYVAPGLEARHELLEPERLGRGAVVIDENNVFTINPFQGGIAAGAGADIAAFRNDLIVFI